MIWVGHVARMGGGGEVLTEFWWEDQMERDYLEDLGVDGLILKYFYALNLSASA